MNRGGHIPGPAWFGNQKSRLTRKGVHLDTRADFADASTSINLEQEQSIDCSHPNSPPHPVSSPNREENPTLAVIAEGDKSMANFPVNPRPFLVRDLQVDHGWNRPARGRIALGGEPSREHEDHAIVSITPMPAEVNQLRPTLNLVSDFLQHDQGVQIVTAHLSPLGLGLIRLRTVMQRNQLVRNSPFHLGQHVIHVVKHDEGINARSCTYIRICWLMFLVFPSISRKICISGRLWLLMADC